MKKTIVWLLVIVLVLSLTACGNTTADSEKSGAAAAVEEMIAGIGTVSLESKDFIENAEKAYEALSSAQKKEVENYAILVAARGSFDTLTAKKGAANVDAAIDAIGTVTIESGDLIAAARAAYNVADDSAKEHVSKLSVLEAAEKTYSQLQANEVIAMIDALGKITTNSGDAIAAAQSAFDALPAETKALVTNADTLTTAAATYKDLCKAAAKKLLSGMYVQEDKVRGMSFYYPSAFPYYTSSNKWAVDKRSFVLPYMGMQGDDVWLRLLCHYTGDDWIFFEKITFAVDDQRFYKYFSYYDVTRDNGGGDVWEYVDIDVGSSEIALLQAIADSNTTIIRFEGDDYYRDVTVTSKDKAAIKEMLQAYAAFQQ